MGGFWDTAGAVALGAGIGVFGQWLADRRIAVRDRFSSNLSFEIQTAEGLQGSIKELWRQYNTTGRRRRREAPPALTQAFVDASAWRSRLSDREFAREIKEWMEDVADACDRRTAAADRDMLVVQYRGLMARLGANLQELHAEPRRLVARFGKGSGGSGA